MADYITVSEVSRLLRISAQTVRNWVKLGVFPAHQLNPGGKFLIRYSDVVKAIERGKILPRKGG